MIFIDMDGVICDFDNKAKELIHQYKGLAVQSLSDVKKGTTWDVVRQYQSSGGLFWLDLDVMDGTYDLFNHLIQHNQPFEILSAVGNKGFNADPQKRDWITKHIDMVYDKQLTVHLVKSSTDKAKYVQSSRDILIDDRLKSIDPWRAAGGTGILHVDMKTTIKELTNILKANDAI